MFARCWSFRRLGYDFLLSLVFSFFVREMSGSSPNHDDKENNIRVCPVRLAVYAIA